MSESLGGDSRSLALQTTEFLKKYDFFKEGLIDAPAMHDDFESQNEAEMSEQESMEQAENFLEQELDRYECLPKFWMSCCTDKTLF